MTFFNYIEPLYKYLHSVRNIFENNKNLLVIDVKFPGEWEVDKFLSVQEKSSVKLQKGGEVKLYSFFTVYTEQGVNDLYEIVINIINKNIEEEKKRELLDKKVKELKKVLENQIQELKNKFEVLPFEELQEELETKNLLDEPKES